MNSKNSNFGQRAWAIVAPFLAIIIAINWLGLSCDTIMAQTKKTRYSSQSDWHIKAEYLKPHGVNPYYHPLIPGFKFVMDEPNFSDDGDEGHYRKEVEVLDKVEPFDIPSIGGKFNCAIVVEKEFLNGIMFSRSLNWYCIDKRNNNVYAMGEEAHETKNFRGDLADTVTETWRTGEPDANGLIDAGLIMPGTPIVGARFLLDTAEGQSLVGAEVVETGLTMATPAGTFENCVRTREYDLMDPEDVTDKVWAYGVGLVFDTSDGRLLESDVLTNNKDKDTAAKDPGSKITEEQARQIALKTVPGEITEVSIEKKLGANRYIIEVQATDGVETDVIINMETGKVLATET